MKDKILQLCKENNIGLYDLKKMIEDQLEFDANKTLQEEVAKHEYVVGKCYRRKVKPDCGMFPEMYRYYKVISPRAENVYRVSCLTFDEKPWYWFRYNSTRFEHSSDHYEGYFEFDGIYVEDIMFHLLTDGTLEEISGEEYINACFRYCEILLNLDWCADHYRLGNKLPTDDDWEVDSNGMA